MRRIIMLSLIVIITMSSMTDARTYKIGVVPWMGWSPAHVAEVKGFWKEQGIDVKVFNFPSNQAVHTAMTHKRIDFGFDMIGTAIGLYLDGLPVVILAETDWSHGGDKIIVKHDLEAADLKGTPVGVYINQPSVTYFLSQYLATLNLKLSDVRIVTMETIVMADKFISGLFKVTVNYDPEALRAEREGNGKVVATSATYEGCIPEGMMVLADVLQDIPQEDLANMFEGYVKAVIWSQDPANWQEYMEILNTHTFKGDAPYSEHDLREMAEAVRIHNPATLLERNRDGGGLQQYLKDLHVFLASNNLLKKEFDSESIFDNSVLMQVLREQ